MVEADNILEEAEEQVHEWRDHVRDAADLFHEREGELMERAEAVQLLEDELDLPRRTAHKTLSALTGDMVDPIVQVVRDGDRYVGVVEFEEFEGAYGYVNFDDRHGVQRRVVCAQCVQDMEVDANVTHATAGDPSGSFSEDASYDDLVGAIHDHYNRTHSTSPEEVETGASLASGTTIGSNTSWHAGNDGESSGLDADEVRGFSCVTVDGEAIITPSYTTQGDVPNIPAGSIVYVQDDNLHYFEDGS